MKRLLVVLLVVVVLLTGIPLVMGMPTADCAECELGVLVAGTCLSGVLVGAAALLASRPRAGLRTSLLALVSRLLDGRLERPPRLA